MFKVEAIGNIGADAEVKEANGSKFITFRVANTDKWKTESGETKERTQWIDVVISNAESNLLPYLKQGVKVFVRGNGSLRVYSSPKLRQLVAGIQINAIEVELCGGSLDDVPRELVDPESAAIIPVTKHYWCNVDTKGMKKDQVKELIDKKGNQYFMNNAGFVTPARAAEENAGG